MFQCDFVPHLPMMKRRKETKLWRFPQSTPCARPSLLMKLLD